MNKLVAPLALAAALAIPSSALAADDAEEGYVTRSEEGGYGVIFLDDLLGAEGIDSAAPLIRASFRPMRGLLIRPRTSFVPELLQAGDGL